METGKRANPIQVAGVSVTVAMLILLVLAAVMGFFKTKPQSIFTTISSQLDSKVYY